MNNKLRDIEHLSYLQSFGENVAKLRKQKGLTQDALADLCGWEASNLRKIEGAKTNPTVKTLLILADGLDLEIEDLFVFER